MGITFKDIDECHRLTKRINDEFDTIGRELYRIREGNSMFGLYRFDEYTIETYIGQHGPKWEDDTPIFIIWYTHSYNGGCDVISVTLPQSWLGRDYKLLDQKRIFAERIDEEFWKKLDEERETMNREIYERKMYEHLKKKFEG